MKRIFILIYFFISLASSMLASEWIFVDTLEIIDRYVNGIKYTRQIFWDQIHCVDSLHCAVIGGVTLECWPICRITTDGGKSWETTFLDSADWTDPKNPYIPYASLGEMSYPDTNLCIMLCDSGYYWLSRDNCKNWQRGKNELGDTTKSPFLNINFYNSKIGAIGNAYEILLTKDGFRTFDRLHFCNPYIDSLGIKLIEFADTSIIYLVFSGNSKQEPFDKKICSIYKSEDFGKTWSKKFEIDRSLNRIFCLDKNNCWIAGGKNFNDPYKNYLVHYIARTTDGGESWETLLDTLYKNYYGIRDIKIRNNLGFAFGHNYTLWVSYDSGVHWSLDTTFSFWQTNDNRIKRGMTFLNDHTILVCSDGYIWKKDYSNPSSVSYELINTESIDLLHSVVNKLSDLQIKLFLERGSSISTELYDSRSILIERSEPIYLEPGENIINYKTNLELSSGMYFLKINRNNGNAVLKKFIIIR